MTTAESPHHRSPGLGVLCLGVGGMGMAPLAILLSQAGYRVLGADDALPNRVRAVLERERVGIIEEATDPAGQIDEVVHSSAIDGNDERLRRWRDRGVPVSRRGERLARLIGDRRVIAIAGSHGKTTTTAMVVELLLRSGRKPGWMIGGLPTGDRSPASWGEEDWFVTEVDESDGTIGAFSPEVAAVLNLDLDHADRYPDRDSIEAAFRHLCERASGKIFLGEPLSGAPVGAVTLQAGDSDLNAVNREVAAAVVRECFGIPAVAGDLHGFNGVLRRQTRWCQQPLEIWEDYAHHPTEISAFLKQRRREGPLPLTVVFQPHRYSRTVAFAKPLARALEIADEVLLLPVYAASEAERRDGGAGRIAAHWQDSGVKHHLLGHIDQLGEALKDREKRGGSVLFVGAGNIENPARIYAALIEAGSVRAGLELYLKRELSAGAVLRRDYSLAKLSTLGVGGPAALLVEPAQETDLRVVLGALRFSGIPWFVMGRGSNVVCADEGFAGVVIRLSAPHWRRLVRTGGQAVRVGAGLSLRELSNRMVREGQDGYAFLEGIPGTVGGALRMNAGAMGQWTDSLAIAVRIMTPDGSVHTLDRERLQPGYRTMAGLGPGIVLSADLRLSPGETSMQSGETYRRFRERRRATQPLEPSAGCAFRNPDGDAAGRLIEACGLKGARDGGAMVSPIHANFVVNTGDATAANIRTLMRSVQRQVHQRFGIRLRPEVIFLGNRGPEELTERGDD